MEIVKSLPSKKGIIGARVVIKNIKSGNVKDVIIAKNCPDSLVKKISSSGAVSIKKFAGDEKELGTKTGKPFPVAAVGY